MASNYHTFAATKTDDRSSLADRSSLDDRSSAREFSILAEKLARPATTGDTLRIPSMQTTSALVDRELRSSLAWNNCSTPHFNLNYELDRFERREIDGVMKLLEQSYSSIFSQTNEAFADRLEMYLVDARSQMLLGRRLSSHLNVEEKTLYLTRLPYQPLHAQIIAHLTHAMRMSRFAKNYEDCQSWALMEDAFAVFLNHRLAPQPDTFPFFGIEPDIIVHELMKNGRVRSLHECWEAPASCTVLERQVLNGAFFLYLGDTYSDERVVELSKCDSDLCVDTFKLVFGKSLDELEAEWVSHLPTSLLAMTRDELDLAITRWEKKIDSHLWC